MRTSAGSAELGQKADFEVSKSQHIKSTQGDLKEDKPMIYETLKVPPNFEEQSRNPSTGHTLAQTTEETGYQEEFVRGYCGNLNQICCNF